MIRIQRSALLLAVALGLGCFAASSQAGDDNKGFVKLFNGKNLEGWKFVPENLAKAVSVKDDYILVKGQPNGYIYTDKSFKNFVLRYDWRYARPKDLEDDKKFGGNSGLLLHIQEPHQVWPKSLEVQGMNRDHGSFIAIGGVKVSNYKFNREALEKARHKVGEWNTTEVDVKNGEVTAKVNGAVVATGKVDVTQGPFGLQSEGAEIHFKNINIKTMD